MRNDSPAHALRTSISKRTPPLISRDKICQQVSSDVIACVSPRSLEYVVVSGSLGLLEGYLRQTKLLKVFPTVG